MKAAVVEIRICPFRIAAGIEKVTILQAATDEHNIVQDKALIVKSLILVYFYFISHRSPIWLVFA
jgi:hypothetical protein